MVKDVWAEPRNLTGTDDCYFYHTMDIPNHGIVHGEWDLRGREAAYLGHVSLRGKRVLEIGTASGHLCFSMEKMGAEVVAYDLSDKQEWDVVPYAGYNCEDYLLKRKEHIRRLNNGFWFAHKAFESAAKAVYGTVYEIPKTIGRFDVCTLGSILLHLRDPFLALQRVTDHVDETVVVTDLVSKFRGRILSAAELLTGSRLIHFLPKAKQLAPFDSWWLLSPALVSEFLQILGFAHIQVSFHRQKYMEKELKLFTVVGHRHKPGA